MRLLLLLLGFIILMTGGIIGVHSTHAIVGLLMMFGGILMMLDSLPSRLERWL
jgi:hypothetical protein